MASSARTRWGAAAAALAALAFVASPLAADRHDSPLAKVEYGPEAVRWHPRAEAPLTLVVSGPGVDLRREFGGGETPYLKVGRDGGKPLPDGGYVWELRAAGKRRAEVDPAERGLKPVAPAPAAVQSGSFTIRDGAVVSPEAREPEPEPRPAAPRRIEGDLEIEGNLEVRGTKSFVVPDPERPGREIAYVALEGPEAGTYLRGSGVTGEGGEAVVELPAHFAAVTEAEGLTVHLTPVGGWSRLYVAEKSRSRLVVREAAGADGARFDYEIRGVRRGYAGYGVGRPAPRPEGG